MTLVVRNLTLSVFNLSILLNHGLNIVEDPILRPQWEIFHHLN